MSADIRSSKTAFIAAAIGAALVVPRSAAADTYSVIGAPGVESARVSEVVDALEATGRVGIAVDTNTGGVVDPDSAAGSSAAAARDAIKAITVSFAELDYARVIAELERAEATHLVSLLATAEGVAALVDINVWLGASLVGAGRAAEASERYAQVLAIDPSYEMDPDYWADEYRAAFGAARERGAPARGSLTIETNPPGASVAVDGAPLGAATPATVEAAAGWHYVYIHSAGHRAWAQRLNVAAGEVKRIPVALTRDEALAAAAAGAAMDGYGADAGAAVRAIAGLTGRDDTIVVTADGLVLHDRTGGVRASATGGGARSQIDALFPGVRVPGGDDGAPWYKNTWFLAGSAVAIVVAGSVSIWAATRTGELRGQFVRP